MSITKHIIDSIKGKHPINRKRSSKWPEVEHAYKEAHPVCEVCGYDKHLQIHHIIPFHIRPDLELDPNNLIALCEPPGRSMKCHLLVGHLGNFRLYNPEVEQDAKVIKEKLKQAHQRRKRNTQ